METSNARHAQHQRDRTVMPLEHPVNIGANAATTETRHHRGTSVVPLAQAATAEETAATTLAPRHRAVTAVPLARPVTAGIAEAKTQLRLSRAPAVAPVEHPATAAATTRACGCRAAAAVPVAQPDTPGEAGAIRMVRCGNIMVPSVLSDEELNRERDLHLAKKAEAASATEARHHHATSAPPLEHPETSGAAATESKTHHHEQKAVSQNHLETAGAASDTAQAESLPQVSAVFRVPTRGMKDHFSVEILDMIKNISNLPTDNDSDDNDSDDDDDDDDVHDHELLVGKMPIFKKEEYFNPVGVAVLEEIKKEDCYQYLRSVYLGTVHSPRSLLHRNGTDMDRYFMRSYLGGFGPMEKEQWVLACKYLCEYISRMDPTNFDDVVFSGYMVDVLMPEAVVYGLQKIYRIGRGEAEGMYHSRKYRLDFGSERRKGN